MTRSQLRKAAFALALLGGTFGNCPAPVETHRAEVIHEIVRAH